MYISSRFTVSLRSIAPGIISPGGNFEGGLNRLRRSVRVMSHDVIAQVLQEAVVVALQHYELKFWEELFLEEGESNCVFWAKLVGLLDPVHEKIIKALRRRKDGDAFGWQVLLLALPPPPELPALNFMDDDMTGFLEYFHDSFV